MQYPRKQILAALVAIAFAVRAAAAAATLVPPVILAPSGGVVFAASTTVTFAWSGPTNAVSYVLTADGQTYNPAKAMTLNPGVVFAAGRHAAFVTEYAADGSHVSSATVTFTMAAPLPTAVPAAPSAPVATSSLPAPPLGSSVASSSPTANPAPPAPAGPSSSAASTATASGLQITPAAGSAGSAVSLALVGYQATAKFSGLTVSFEDASGKTWPIIGSIFDTLPGNPGGVQSSAARISIPASAASGAGRIIVTGGGNTASVGFAVTASSAAVPASAPAAPAAPVPSVAATPAAPSAPAPVNGLPIFLNLGVGAQQPVNGTYVSAFADHFAIAPMLALLPGSAGSSPVVDLVRAQDDLTSSTAVTLAQRAALVRVCTSLTSCINDASAGLNVAIYARQADTCVAGMADPVTAVFTCEPVLVHVGLDALPLVVPWLESAGVIDAATGKEILSGGTVFLSAISLDHVAMDSVPAVEKALSTAATVATGVFGAVQPFLDETGKVLGTQAVVNLFGTSVDFVFTVLKK